MMKTIKLRFETHFEIFDSLLMLDLTNPLCLGLKLLRSYIQEARNNIVEV